jgi:hypothetical protein
MHDPMTHTIYEESVKTKIRPKNEQYGSYRMKQNGLDEDHDREVMSKSLFSPHAITAC